MSSGISSFPALQAALSEGDDEQDRSISCSICCLPKAKICASCRLRERKERLQALLKTAERETQCADPLRRITSRSRAKPCCSRPAACHLEGIISKRLDAPYISGRTETGPRRNAAAGRK